LTPDQIRGGMNYIEDLDALVANDKIIPENSAGSLIIKRMTDGSMPPAYSNLPKVTQADINTVAQFIDNPLSWRDEGAPAEANCPNQLIDFDQLYADVAEDLADLDADDALTARYISLTNRYTAGVCAPALDRDRQGLFKMVNALSTDTTVRAPLPIDGDQLIYRIDLADYGWDEPVNVVDADGNIIAFTDKWEAIVDANPYAVPFVGEDADDAVQDSGTLVPVMFADSMIDVATIGNLYYALIDVDVTQTLDDFVLNVLDIDVVQNLADEEQVRAGTTRSRISRQDRLITRDDIGVRSGVLWQSFDFLDDDGNDSIFEDPFGFAEGGIEAIFTLPNGMFGYIIADAVGAIVEDSDILLDTSQNNFRVTTSISCSGCHQTGFIPVEDEVREVALANARSSGLIRDEIEQLEAVFPNPDVFARQVEDDTNDFYRAALSKIDLPIQGQDPVQFVFLRFDQDIDLASAAGDLGLAVDDLERELRGLEPEVNVLGNTRVDRDDFTQFYVDSLCKLSTLLENQPDPIECQAAADLILADDL
jgi:hypothetical protein